MNDHLLFVNLRRNYSVTKVDYKKTTIFHIKNILKGYREKTFIGHLENIPKTPVNPPTIIARKIKITSMKFQVIYYI